MPDNILKRATAWLAEGAASSLLLAAALVVQSSCVDRKAARTQPAPLALTNAAAHEAAWNTALSPDPLADNLLRVLSDWGNREVAVLERSVTLKSMWAETHSANQEYERKGIAELRNRLRAHPYFKHRAEKLTRHHLVPGGAVQTQGQLYDFLAAF